MRKLVAIILAISVSLTLAPMASAASTEEIAAANSLYTLKLFNGTGTDKNGNPIFDLDRTPTRNEAIAMLVRLIGAEKEAKNGVWHTPFTDVAAWAQPYVGYAYENGLTTGISATQYGGDQSITPAQYITFILRALEYESGVDFSWETSWKWSDELGITKGRYSANTKKFTRGDVAFISCEALKAEMKEWEMTLISYLLFNTSAISKYQTVCDAGLGDYVFFTTLDNPSGLFAMPNSDGNLTLYWKKSPDDVSDAANRADDITGYEICLSTSEYGKYSWWIQNVSATHHEIFKNSFIATNKLNTTYYVKVRAYKIVESVDEKGNISYSTKYSGYSNAIPINVSDQPMVADRNERILKIIECIDDAITYQLYALDYANSALRQTSASSGLWYAQLAQKRFSRVESDMYIALMLCDNYPDLSDLKVPISTIYAITSANASVSINALTYPAFCRDAIAFINGMTGYYQELTNMIQNLG